LYILVGFEVNNVLALGSVVKVFVLKRSSSLQKNVQDVNKICFLTLTSRDYSLWCPLLGLGIGMAE